MSKSIKLASHQASKDSPRMNVTPGKKGGPMQTNAEPQLWLTQSSLGISGHDPEAKAAQRGDQPGTWSHTCTWNAGEGSSKKEVSIYEGRPLEKGLHTEVTSSHALQAVDVAGIHHCLGTILLQNSDIPTSAPTFCPGAGRIGIMLPTCTVDHHTGNEEPITKRSFFR